MATCTSPTKSTRAFITGLITAALLVPTAGLAAPPPVPTPPPVPGDVVSPPDVPRRIAQPQRRNNKRKGNKRKGKHRRGHMSPEERDQLEEAVGRKMDTFITVEVSSQLGLSDEKALKLSRLLRERRETKRAARKQARQEYKALQELLDSGASDGALKAQTRKVIDAAQAAEAPPDLLAATSGFMSPKEQARLVLVLPHLRREMRHMMRRARQDMKHRRKGGGGGGPRGFDGMEDDF